MDRDAPRGDRVEGQADRSESLHVAGAAEPTPEDLICLQSAIDELRHGREVLIRRLQAAESGGQEKIQLAESRLREALAQIAALKRSSQAVRARLEAEVLTARKRADERDEALRRSIEAREQIQINNAELTTALEAAEYRIADLDTESSAHAAELERLEQERVLFTETAARSAAEIETLRQALATESHAAATATARQAELTEELACVRAEYDAQADLLGQLRAQQEQLEAAVAEARQQYAAEASQRHGVEQQLATVTAELASAREQAIGVASALDDLRQQSAREGDETGARVRALDEQLTTERQHGAELQAQLEHMRATHGQELAAWHETASEREAELVAARDELARRLEEEQSQACIAREEAAAVAERARGLEADVFAAVQQRQEVEQEITVLREERLREREIFENAAREREEQHRLALAAVETERARSGERIAAVQSDLEASVRHAAELEERLHAALRDADVASGELEGRDTAIAALTEQRSRAEDNLRQRDQVIEALRAEAELVAERDAGALHALTEEAQQRAEEWRSLQQTLQEEAANARAELSKGHIFVEAARAQALAFEAQLADADAQRARLSQRIVVLERDMRARDAGLAQLTADAEQAEQRHADELDALQTRFDEQFAPLRAEAAATQAARAGLEEQLETLRGQLAERDAKERNLSEHLIVVEEQLRARDLRCEQLTADVERLAREYADELQTAQTRSREELAAARAEAATAAAATEAACEQIQAINAHLGQQASAHANVMQQLAALETEIRGREDRIAQLTAEAELFQRQHADELQHVRAAASQEKAEWRAVHDTLRQQLEAAQHAVEIAQAQLDPLTVRLTERTREMQRLTGELDTLRTIGREHAESLAKAEQRATELEYARDQWTRQREELDQQLSAAVHAQQLMGGQVESMGNEHRELLQRVEELTALTNQLERECERLRRERTSPDDVRRSKVEISRLEAKSAETERQHAEAVQRHSAAVAGYMLELNQRTEDLHARDLELQRLGEELAITRQACEDGVAQLETVRQERVELEQQLNELRAATAGDKARGPIAKTSRPATPEPAPPTRPEPQRPVSQSLHATGPLRLVHVEENKAYREAVRAIISQVPEAKYLTAAEADHTPGARRQVLLVNLLDRTQDPFAAICATLADDAETTTIVTYCADGSSGFSLGSVDFFAQPIDPNDVVARLLDRRGMIQRLLAVSDDVEMTNSLRKLLAPMRCSVPSAFDTRQALDLLPMIDPEVVLIDFALPRGEGLRLTTRLRADAKTRSLPLAVVLPTGLNAADFRRFAVPAVREFPMSPEQLSQAVADQLALPVAEQGKSPEMLRVG